MCRSCPANSNSTEQGVTECPCFDGYYRAMGEEDLPCTCVSISKGVHAHTISMHYYRRSGNFSLVKIFAG